MAASNTSALDDLDAQLGIIEKPAEAAKEPAATVAHAAPAPDEKLSALDSQLGVTDAPAEQSAQAQPATIADSLPEAARPLAKAAGEVIKIGRGVARVKDGVVQASLDGLEKMGIVDKGTANEFTKMTNEERSTFNKRFKAVFGDDAGFHIAEAGGEILPAFYVPQVALKGALARIGVGAATGAAFGAAGYQGDEDMTKRTEGRITAGGVGGALGGGASTLLEGFTYLRNIIPKAIETVRNLHGSQYAEGIDVQNRTGVLFKLSNLFPDPLVEEAERFARSGVVGERLGRQIEDAQPQQVLDYFEGLLTNNKGVQVPFGKRVEVAFDRIMGDVKLGSGLLGNRAVAADRNFAAAQKAGGYIDMTNFTGTALKLANEFGGPGALPAGKRMAAELESMVADIGESTGGRLTPKQLQKRLQELGAAAKGTGKIFTDTVDRAAEKGPAKLLFSALNRDLDEAIEAGGAGAAELKKARDMYAFDSAKIESIRQSALGKLFKSEGTPSVAEIEGTFLKMHADELRSTMLIVNKADPQAAQHLQNLWLTNAIEKAKVPGEAGAVPFLPAKLLDLVSGAKGAGTNSNAKTFDAVFTDPKVKAQVVDGLKAVQLMMVNNMRSGGRTVARYKNLGNQIAQANPMNKDSLYGDVKALALKFGANFMAPEMVSRYVLDPKGVKALNTLSKGFGTASRSATWGTTPDMAVKISPNNPASAAMAELWNIYSKSAEPDDEE